jgi:hypothetical protein
MAAVKSSSSLREAKAPPAPPAQAWREGEFLVMKDGGTAPRRCVKCNAEAQEPAVPIKMQISKQRFTGGVGSSATDAAKAIRAVGQIADVAYALATLRRATVNVYACELHRPKKRNMVLACIILGVGIIASIICTVLAMRTEHAMGFSFGGIAAFMISMIAGGLLLKLLVRAERIEGGVVWMRGAGEAFLASLEPWKGESE